MNSRWDDAACLWIDPLQEAADETWIVYDVRKGQVPSLSDNLDGVVLSGSECSVYDSPRPAWYEPLAQYIRSVVSLSHTHPTRGHTTRILGGCFGAQMIADVLGGRVAAQPHFTLCVEQIHVRVNPDHATFKLSRPSYCLVESHGDAVMELPPNSQLIASSATCQHEIFSVGDCVLALQCHPEFDLRTAASYPLREKIWLRHIEEERHGMNPATLEQSVASFEEGNEVNDKDMLRELSAWLHGAHSSSSQERFQHNSILSYCLYFP